MSVTWALFVRENSDCRWEFLSMTDHDERVSEWEDTASEERESGSDSTAGTWEYAIVPVDDFIVTSGDHNAVWQSHTTSSDWRRA